MYHVRYMNKMSKSFEVKTGLRKGDVLSPVLFNLALEQMVRNIKDNSSMELVGNITLLAYANDVVILDESQDQIISSTLKLIEVKV